LRESGEREGGLGQALECTHTSAEAKPRSLARSLAGEARETGEREMERLSLHTHTLGGLSLSAPGGPVAGKASSTATPR